MKQKSGIYCIKNTENERCYIGCSSDVSKRITNHKTMLRGNRHNVPELQLDWNIHGEDCFKFSILEFVQTKELHDIENKYINAYNSVSNGYNTVGGKDKYTDIHERKTYYIEKELLKKIDKLCDRNNLDKSYIINEALKLFFNTIEGAK